MNSLSSTFMNADPECISNIYRKCLENIHQDNLNEILLDSKSDQNIKEKDLIILMHLSNELEDTELFDFNKIEDINQLRSLIMFTISLRNQTLSSKRLKNCIKLFGDNIFSAENAGIHQSDWSIRGFLPTAYKCNNLECASLLMQCSVKKIFAIGIDDFQDVQDELSGLYTFMEKADYMWSRPDSQRF